MQIYCLSDSGVEKSSRKAFKISMSFCGFAIIECTYSNINFVNSFLKKVLNGLSGNCQQQYGFPLKAAMICLLKQIYISIDSNLFHVCLNFSVSEPAISTAHCPRLYGIFADEAKCDVFWNCWNGEASRYQCSPGLAYDREARVCMWADQVPECKSEGNKMFPKN